MKDGLIPLLVGVTGHQKFSNKNEDLQRIIGNFFSELKQAYRNSPIILLSSLAEGADQLAAQIALDKGMELIVPLPMELKDYRTDFTTNESRDKFDALLESAQTHFVTLGVPGVDPPEPRQAESRKWFYARASHYIVQHSHILLALWDGEPADEADHTAEVVHQKRYGLPFAPSADRKILDPPESGTIYHIVTPRPSKPSTQDDVIQVRKFYANSPEFELGEGWTTERKIGEKWPEPKDIFLSLLNRADGFNRDARSLTDNNAAEFQKSLSYIQPGEELGELDSSFQRLLGQFAAADALAISFQQKRHRSLKILCILIVPTSLSLAAYDILGAEYPVLAFLCLILFWCSVARGIFVYHQAWKYKFETKHLDYRALAEGLRVLFFWRLAGIRDDIGAQYLRKHWSEVDWIRLAIRTSDPILSSPIKPIKVEICVLTHWIIDQLEFFKKAQPKNQRLAEAHEQGAPRWVLGGLAVAVVLTVCQGVFCFLSSSAQGWLHPLLHPLSLGVVYLLAWAGAKASFAEKMAFAPLSKQYAPMLRLFERAVKQYEECLDPLDSAQIQSIVRQVGKEALRENGDWVLLYRERPMDMNL